MRAAIALSVAWAAVVSATALYECFTVDPWRFIGEGRHAIFFRWSPHLVYGKSPLGDFVLVFDPVRFWLVLLLPVVALVASALVLRLWFKKRNAVGVCP